jgi:hypothetical protein
MAEMITRPVYDNRLQRAIAGIDRKFTLGSALSQLTAESGTSGLMVKRAAINEAQSQAFTDEQQQRIAQESWDRQLRITDLQFSMADESDPAKRDIIASEIQALDSGVMSVVDRETQSSIEAGRLVPKNDLQSEYGDLGLVFDRPMTAEAARLLAKGKQEEIVRNTIVEGSPGGFAAGVVKFGASALAMAVDPVDLGSAFIPIVGVGGRAYAVTRIGKTLGRTVVGVTEGVVGAAITEPLYYNAAQGQQLDYTMSDALFNIGAGALFGGFIGTVAGVFSRSVPEVQRRGLEVSGGEITIGGERIEVPSVRMESPDAVDIEWARANRPDESVENVPYWERFDMEAESRAADVAVRQVTNDIQVAATVAAQRAPKRPQTLSELVRQSGGINDQDPTFRGELANQGINPAPAGKIGINNPKSPLNLDDMAEQAYELGFIENRDVNELLDMLRNERDGTDFGFARQDTQAAADWRNHYEAKSNAEAYLAHIDDIKASAKQMGIDIDLTPEQLIRVSDELGRNGNKMNKALETEGIFADQASAKALAELSGMEYDPYLDFEFSRAVDEMDVPDFERDLEYDIATYGAIINQAREAGELSDEALAELADLDQIDIEARSYSDAVEAASICVART